MFSREIKLVSLIDLGLVYFQILILLSATVKMKTAQYLQSESHLSTYRSSNFATRFSRSHRGRCENAHDKTQEHVKAREAQFL